MGSGGVRQQQRAGTWGAEGGKDCALRRGIGRGRGPLANRERASFQIRAGVSSKPRTWKDQKKLEARDERSTIRDALLEGGYLHIRRRGVVMRFHNPNGALNRVGSKDQSLSQRVRLLHPQ